MASIKGLSSVFPKYKVFQEEIKEIGRKLFSSKIQLDLVSDSTFVVYKII